MARPELDFWFEFGSTYSYPTSQRIQALARDRGVAVRFRPFMLGAIFKAQGWDTSPFNIYPAKGRYMWRDMERICGTLGLTLVRPDPFPQNSLLAARVGVAVAAESWAGDYCAEVFLEEFARGRPIADQDVLLSLLARFSAEAPLILERANTPQNKEKLKEETHLAAQIGVFGSPTFVTMDGELFWGNDRLETALDWACRGSNIAAGKS
ncbi:2-hydroxychromene-2-carboxylate isomerase [Hyphomicrobium sp. LHD-15]|uniref:2-hydroxychromene-2-carboxylate isomerase n=1 Tax=Hyphomicrobium sp. LHD-15 TaxID=3072142 RepID=UPI00280D8533|nr:2-hydroxychromene-2-carboxylate isomerase [Hyphomicrobium sp. LHD-15]MDQ8697460.1 2-hydroxychromene-2-carboxylate isomerase [Hyphomicrobium sp. LHD-15]